GEREGQRRAGSGERAGHRAAAERARRQQDDLPLVHVGRQALGQVVVAGRGDRRDHDLGAGDRLGEIGRHARQARAARAALGGQGDRGVLRQRAQGLRGTAPETNRVAGQREVGGGRESAVAGAEDGDVHAIAPVAWSSAIFTFEYLSRRVRISLVCSPRRGGGVTSRPIVRSILIGVPGGCVLPWGG